MKRTVTIFMVCVLILSCLVGCSSNKQPEIEATLNPTETLVSPTEEVTEVPTEVVELTEEEKTQLKYEKMFTDGTYIIDWSCVTIDIGANIDNGNDYRVELFSDENGVFWEMLTSLEKHPCVYNYKVCSIYYRENAETAYYTENNWDESTPSRWCFVDVNSANTGNAVTETWENTQILFNKLISQKNTVFYAGTEESMDIVILNPGATEPLFFYIDPDTCEVKKIYIKTLEKNYYVEFVDKAAEDITMFNNIPFTITQTITYEQARNYREEILTYLTEGRHACYLETGSYYFSLGVQLPVIEATETEEVIAEKQLKWEKVFTENAYVLDWSSIVMKQWIPFRMNTGYFETWGRLIDEHGVWWGHSQLNYNAHQSKYYRFDETAAYFCTERDTGTNWYLVDTSVPWPKDKVAERCEWYRDFVKLYLCDEEYYTQVKYTKSINGLDVVELPASGYLKQLKLYINPDTYEVKYISFGWMDWVVDAEIVYEDNVYIHTQVPKTIQGTISCADIPKYQDEIYQEAINHGH